jgi:nucleoside-diphosphate-sugar epimerase
MSTCIITGATGYIGSHLVRYLADQDFELHVLARESSTIRWQGKNEIRVWLYKGQYEDVANVFKHLKHDPPIVFHLAAKVLHEHESSLLDDLMAANFNFGIQILEAMKSYGSSYLVNTGTYWQHEEENYSQPNSLYAAGKEAFQSVISYYCKNYSISAVTLMLMDVYGPQDPRGKIFQQLNEHATTGKSIDVTLCEQKTNLVHIVDVVRAYQCAAELLEKSNGGGHHKYYVAHQKTHILKEVIELYLERMEMQLQINWGAIPYRKNQIMNPYIGEYLPNWKAKIDLEYGLASLLS